MSISSVDRSLRSLACIAATGSLFACDLGEVEVPTGEPMVVVQAVMRPDLDQQFIVLERSFTGSIEYNAAVDAIIPSEGAPRSPIEGALVTVANLDYTDDPCGSAVEFGSEPPTPGLFEQPGVYWGPPTCPSMRAGDRLELRVETPNGDTVGGLTIVPAMDGAVLSMAGDSLAFGTDTVTEFNRDTDTLSVRIEAREGRLMQLDVLRSGDLDLYQGEDVVPGAKIFVDSTFVTLPGNLIDVFAQGEGDDVFRAGRTYRLSVGLADANYFDFARSSNNPFTGRGFINRLTGGIGVFGSLVATSTPLKVFGDIKDTREGAYRLEGQIDDVTIHATLTLFLARSAEDAEFSAFLDGDWLQLVHLNEGVDTWVPWVVDSRAVDGTFEGNLMTGETIQIAPIGADTYMQRLVLQGLRLSGVSFRVTLEEAQGKRLIPIGTLTATQQ